MSVICKGDSCVIGYSIFLDLIVLFNVLLDFNRIRIEIFVKIFLG